LVVAKPHCPGRRIKNLNVMQSGRQGESSRDRAPHVLLTADIGGGQDDPQNIDAGLQTPPRVEGYEAAPKTFDTGKAAKMLLSKDPQLSKIVRPDTTTAFSEQGEKQAPWRVNAALSLDKMGTS
jgi:hypothetical protein